MDQRTEALVMRVRREITTWREPQGWRNESDCALIDTIFSTRAKYSTTVIPLVERWRSSVNRTGDGRLSSILEVPLETFRTIVRNEQLVPGRSPLRMRKYRAVYEVAGTLVNRGWDTPDQIRLAASESREELRNAFCSISGVGRAQFSYFLMLLGVEGVKADTLVTAWVEKATGATRLTQSEVEDLVQEAAQAIGVEPIILDHNIWWLESVSRKRRFRR